MNYEGATLIELYYAGDERSSLDGQGTLVLISTFDTDDRGVDGSFPQNATIPEWSWALMKNADGYWEVVNYGYA